MAGLLGQRDLRDLILPLGVDAAVLLNQRNRDGTTYEEVVNRFTSAMVAFNSGLANHPWISGLATPTDQQVVDYAVGGGGDWELHAEYTGPDEERAEITGHMLPLRKYDKGLGWTYDYLLRSRNTQIDADITNFFDGALNMYEKAALTAFFKFEEVTGATNGLGATGVAVPFADGGNGTIDFTPRSYGGQTFLSTHNHYLRDTLANISVLLEAMALHLAEHGHMSPYDLIVSLADVATYRALTNFYARPADGIKYGFTQDTAIVAEPYIGVISTASGTFRVLPSARVPTGYLGAYKNYGPSNARSPLRWFYDSIYGQGIAAVSGDKLGFPTQRIYGYSEYGFGVGPDRTNGVLGKIAASSIYSTPTIS